MAPVSPHSQHQRPGANYRSACKQSVTAGFAACNRSPISSYAKQFPEPRLLRHGLRSGQNLESDAAKFGNILIVPIPRRRASEFNRHVEDVVNAGLFPPCSFLFQSQPIPNFCESPGRLALNIQLVVTSTTVAVMVNRPNTL